MSLISLPDINTYKILVRKEFGIGLGIDQWKRREYLGAGGEIPMREID